MHTANHSVPCITHFIIDLDKSFSLHSTEFMERDCQVQRFRTAPGTITPFVEMNTWQSRQCTVLGKCKITNELHIVQNRIFLKSTLICFFTPSAILLSLQLLTTQSHLLKPLGFTSYVNAFLPGLKSLRRSYKGPKAAWTELCWSLTQSCKSHLGVSFRLCW